ncbi:MAG: response regulator [Kiloniellaceae bacterium]
MHEQPQEPDILNLLLVEDDEIDRMALKRAFKRKALPVNIVEATDGQEALNILHGQSNHAAPPKPFIILLDINMPQMNGIEMLRRLRSETNDPKLRNTIVFMLTTSQAEKDLENAYAHNVAGYLVKSADKGGLDAIVELLWDYGQVVEFP